ncbi:MAG: mercuric reductase [Spirochaetes bacterium]|nr:mercuric reductase [Spirochaetota bacterium]MBU0954063.1 mercuric reductase [Spirochaetota bacterium]
MNKISDTFLMDEKDKDNRRLLDNVHPAGWQNPEPQTVYNLVVIGAGTAGLISAIGAAGLGAKVALIERHLMGGDCLNVGCVPSKALIHSANSAHRAAHAGKAGLGSKPADPEDFPGVMQRVRAIRADISHNDSAQRYKDMGIDVFIGNAVFSGKNQIDVGGKTLNFRKAIIATGARAVSPPIPGLAESGYLTNETIFNLKKLPGHLVVIGGGPIGCELAQAFRRLGAEVTIIELFRFLPREDPDAAALLADTFRREKIQVLLETTTLKVELSNGRKRIHIHNKDGDSYIDADQILIGAGRQPNVDGLELEKAGVTYDAKLGIKVNDFLQTSNRNIYAAGDICMAWKFTHAADAAARIALQNSLFGGRKRLSDLTMPWCTYTDPEIAHVGLYEADAPRLGIEVESYTVNMSENDRAITEGETEGFIKISVKKGTDTIVGATIMAAQAGNMISEISVAMAGKVGLKKLYNVIHPYPTQADAIRRVAGVWNRTRLTPKVAAFLKWMLRRQLH